MLLEISIVTIPCNQDSWTLAATASKALQLSEERLKGAPLISVPESSNTATVESAEINSNQEEEKMSKNLQVANNETAAETAAADPAAGAVEIPAEETAAAADPAAGVVAAETTESKGVGDQAPAAEPMTVLSRANAALKAFEDRRKAAEETKQAPQILEVNTKGLFAEEQAKRQPTLWDLFDILCAVKWQLMDRKWAMEWVDGVEDNFDYVGEYRVACQEFAEAAVKSFAYYGGFELPAAESSESSVDGDESITDEIISNALDLQKSYEVFAGIYEKSAGENKTTLKSIGDEMIALAEKAGIPLGRGGAEVVAGGEVSEDVIRKSQVFLDTETRAKTAEAEAGRLKTELEVATAGLRTAVEVVEKVAQQPLPTGSRA